MSYTNPYLFYADSGTSLNVWAFSNDFDCKIGMATSGSITALFEKSVNGWGYNSIFTGSVITCSAPSDGIYVVEVTSTTEGKTGSFQLFISEGVTASVDTGQTTTGVGRLTCSPKAGKMFSMALTDGPPTSLVAIDVYSYTVTNTYDYGSSVLCDCVYNSVDDTVWVWYFTDPNSFLDVYNSSGSIVLTSSIPISVDFNGSVPNTFYPPRMAYNNDTNQILLMVSNNNYDAELNYYIVNCSDGTIAHSEVMSFSGVASNCAYASASKAYYIVSDTNSDNILKVDGIAYTSSLTTMSGSSYMLSYIEELNVLVGGSAYKDYTTGALIYDVITDTYITHIAGIGDGESNAIYDPCRKSIVISDDTTVYIPGNNHGGLICANSGSYTPSNFYSWDAGIYYIAYCPPTSTVWASNYSDGQLIAIVLSKPTGSFPVPPFKPPTASFSGTPLSGVAPLTVTFTNTSTHATSYYWDFGDGNFSTSTDPNNTYVSPGLYTVSLLASGSGGSNTLSQSHYISASAYVQKGAVVGWWTFDDSAASPWYDAVSGSMYFNNSDVTPQTTGSGKVGHALQMITNGGSVTIPIATSSVSLVYTSSGFTIATWFKMDVVGDTTLRYDGYSTVNTAIFDPSHQVEFAVYFGYGSNQWQVQFYTASNGFSSPTVTELFPYTPVIGEWHLHRFSYDYNLGKIIYQIDTGSQQVGISTYQYFNSSSTSGRISMRQDPAVGDSNVSWDEMNWSNYVLSDAEVNYLYNSGSGRTWPVPFPL
jgi:PKD repeat protein